MSGVSDIEELISSMRAELLPDVYVFATTQDESLASAVSAKMTFREAEGLTLILTREEALRRMPAERLECSGEPTFSPEGRLSEQFVVRRPMTIELHMANLARLAASAGYRSVAIRHQCPDCSPRGEKRG